MNQTMQTMMKSDLMTRKFVLDENITPCFFDLHNSNVIPFKKIAKPGTPDDILLERVWESGHILITQDKGMVINAILRQIDIVYQDPVGDRHFVPSSMSKTIAKECGMSKKFTLSSSQKRMKTLSHYLGLQFTYGGIGRPEFL